jgi:hypothetical protein
MVVRSGGCPDPGVVVPGGLVCDDAEAEVAPDHRGMRVAGYIARTLSSR